MINVKECLPQTSWAMCLIFWVFVYRKWNKNPRLVGCKLSVQAHGLYSSTMKTCYDISIGTNAVRYDTQMIMVCHNEMIKNQLKFLQESIQLTVQQLCIFKCVHLTCEAHFIIAVKANEECSNFGIIFYIYLLYYIAKTNTR